MSISVPMSRCCRCFKEHPERQHTYKQKLGVLRYSLSVPLCSQCYNRVMTVNTGRYAATTIFVLGGPVAAQAVSTLALGGVQEALALLLFVAMWTLGAAAFVLLPKRLGTELVHFNPMPRSTGVTVTFTNPDYNRLYQQSLLQAAQHLAAAAKVSAGRKI